MSEKISEAKKFEEEKFEKRRTELQEDRDRILKELRDLEDQVASPVREYGTDTPHGRNEFKAHLRKILRNTEFELERISVLSVDSETKK